MAFNGNSEALLIMGPPGAGKGTQAQKLARARNLKRLSTGDLLRDQVKRRTELGVQAKAVMDEGKLVSDDLIIEMVRSELQQGETVRVLLDGFPRTAAQAEALDGLLAELRAPLRAVILLEVAEEELINRLVSRAEQEDRSDDNEETIRRRMEVYQSQTAPLIEYYRGQGKLKTVDGVGSVEEVFGRISEVLP